MRTVFVLFDSLNRSAIGAYGSQVVKTPNFDRFAARAVSFDNHYVGSLPCMPARRDLHSGRLNFMHRSWGPLEPFDNSFPKIMSAAGVYSHIVSDHLHYFEDGGGGYTNAFDSWEFIRGQENDPWIALVRPPLDRFRELFDQRHYKLELDPERATRENMPRWSWKKLRHAVNREHIREEEEFPTVQCFTRALDFLARNQDADDWFLQVEAFDPHEPFQAPQRFKDMYPTTWTGPILDWPAYERVAGSPEAIAEIKSNYAALVSMCDDQFGRLLDVFDRLGLWENTCLILTTDHGYLLAEHEWWGKNAMPYYTDISRIPLIVYHPDHSPSGGERRSRLTQAIDLMPTFLDLHRLQSPPEVRGRSILPLLECDRSDAEIRIFGMFSGPLGATDGRYLYFRYPENLHGAGLNEYTLMPNHMNGPFTLEELRQLEVVEPFDFTKSVPMLRMPALRDVVRPAALADEFEGHPRAELFDLEADPRQQHPLEDPEVEERFLSGIIRELQRHNTPPEVYRHFNLTNEP